MTSPHTLPPRFMLGRYEIDQLLGAGGFGITYRAIDRKERRYVAIKEYFPRAAAMRDQNYGVWVSSASEEAMFRKGLQRFHDEAMTIRNFNHPYIARVFDIFAANGTGYLVLEYVDGHSLQQWIRSGGRPRQEEFDGFVAAFLEALDLIHRHGVLHRDIAPKNILLSRSGHPVLIDFGSARQMMQAQRTPLTALVSQGYSPYEQYTTSGRQGPWTDIYAVGATLYEIATGRAPPEAPARTLRDTCLPAAQATRMPYRRQFLDAIDWALKVMPQDRPQSVAQWRSALLWSGPSNGYSGLVQR